MRDFTYYRRHKGEAVYGLVTACIPILGCLIFMVIPMILAIIISFNTPTGYSLINMEYVGFDNYKFVLTDPTFWKSVGNTFYSLLSIPIGIIIGLILAVILNQKDLKGKSAFKTIFFIPFVTSVVATSIVWKYLLDEDFGLINQLLVAIGIPGQGWLTDSKLVMPTMIALSIWNSIGYTILLYSAALTTISDHLYEAAAIDGANAWQKFWNITFPGVWPVTFYLILTGIINGLQDFARFQVMLPDGGPNSAGLTIVFYLYKRGWEEIITYGMGIASATSWILAMFILIFSGFTLVGNKKVEGELK